MKRLGLLKIKELKCKNCRKFYNHGDIYCVKCGTKHQTTEEENLDILTSSIYNRYLEIFHKPENSNLKDKYNKLISDSAFELINEFHYDCIDGFLDLDENASELPKINYIIYRRLRLWIRTQIQSGTQLVIARRLYNNESIRAIGVGSKKALKEYVEERIANVNLNKLTDELNLSLITKDVQEAMKIIKSHSHEFESISLGFMKRFENRLTWATAYGVLITSWVELIRN